MRNPLVQPPKIGWYTNKLRPTVTNWVNVPLSLAALLYIIWDPSDDSAWSFISPIMYYVVGSALVGVGRRRYHAELLKSLDDTRTIREWDTFKQAWSKT